jgi:hypothetical protein
MPKLSSPVKQFCAPPNTALERTAAPLLRFGPTAPVAMPVVSADVWLGGCRSAWVR